MTILSLFAGLLKKLGVAKFVLKDKRLTKLAMDYDKFARLVENGFYATLEEASHFIDNVHLQSFRFANFELEVMHRDNLSVLINEILVTEDYYFSAETENPLILDCGTNFGLAICYFKHLYPGSHIIGFEPDPQILDVAVRNVRRNKLANVEILPFALAERDGLSRFFRSEKDLMAGSLTQRRKNAGDEVSEFMVETKRLSHYLQNKVDYLKLDIEGSEDLVLCESAELLRNVRYIFCEYHHGLGLPHERLLTILSLLDEKGFDYQVAKSFSYQATTRHQPMNYVGQPYSALIFAKNRNWIKS